jgi:hypothetical protein
VFTAGCCIFADDVVLYGEPDPDGRSQALDCLKVVCSSISLDMSVKKTEWVCQAEMASCAPGRKPGPCCDRIKLAGVPITHTPKFCYLGSVIPESGGVSVESTTCMGKAVAALNRMSKYWSLPASVRAKS